MGAQGAGTLFPSEEDFEQHRRATPGLSRLVESLSHRVFPVPGQDEEETAQTVEQVAEWLEMDAMSLSLPVSDIDYSKSPIGSLSPKVNPFTPRLRSRLLASSSNT